MGKGEEHQIDTAEPLRVEGLEHAIAAAQVGMNLPEALARTPVCAEPHELERRMPVEDPDEFASGIAGGAEDGRGDHTPTSIRIFTLYASVGVRVRRPATNQVWTRPIPFISTAPRGTQTYSASIRSRVARETWTRPGSPCDSRRLAVLTVSPHTSYWNLLVPMTPATTGPELMPIRNSNGVDVA